MKSILFSAMIAFFSISAIAAGPITIPLPNGATLWILPVDDEDSIIVSVAYDTGAGVIIPPPVCIPSPCE